MINHDLFRNQTIFEIMRENFIIVQHFVVPNSSTHDEGGRLHQLYGFSPLPFPAILNPLTGGEMHHFSKFDYENADRFTESRFSVSPSPP